MGSSVATASGLIFHFVVFWMCTSEQARWGTLTMVNSIMYCVRGSSSTGLPAPWLHSSHFPLQSYSQECLNRCWLGSQTIWHWPIPVCSSIQGKGFGSSGKKWICSTWVFRHLGHAWEGWCLQFRDPAFGAFDWKEAPGFCAIVRTKWPGYMGMCWLPSSYLPVNCLYLCKWWQSWGLSATIFWFNGSVCPKFEP